MLDHNALLTPSMNQQSRRLARHKGRYVRAVSFSVSLTILLCGCSSMSREIRKQSSSTGHFASPEEAVPIIAELLQKRDFKALASYYDLSGSGISLDSLESGDFFIRKERPETAHPAGFWRYKHPFPPGATFSGMSPGPKEDVALIQVEIVIDQGEGSPSQVGIDSFHMIKSVKGWQILPDTVAEGETPEPPSLAPSPMPDPPWER
jgi:hypothetical protein